jgi:hypothetical protein
MSTTRKPTVATLKSFAKRPGLLIRVRAKFDGMVDGTVYAKDAQFSPAEPTDRFPRNTIGIKGAWIVGGGRDYITREQVGGLDVLRVQNCCGSFDLAVPAA